MPEVNGALGDDLTGVCLAEAALEGLSDPKRKLNLRAGRISVMQSV